MLFLSCILAVDIDTDILPTACLLWLWSSTRRHISYISLRKAPSNFLQNWKLPESHCHFTATHLKKVKMWLVFDESKVQIVKAGTAASRSHKALFPGSFRQVKQSNWNVYRSEWAVDSYIYKTLRESLKIPLRILFHRAVCLLYKTVTTVSQDVYCRSSRSFN